MPLWAVMLWLVAIPPAAAFEFRAHDHGEYGRLVMDWDRPVPVTVTGDQQVLRVRAAEPMTGSLAPVIDALDGYLSGLALAPGGRDMVLDFAAPMSVNTALIDGAAVLDFRPATIASLNGAALPPPPAPPPSLGSVELNLPPLSGSAGDPVPPADPAAPVMQSAAPPTPSAASAAPTSAPAAASTAPTASPPPADAEAPAARPQVAQNDPAPAGRDAGAVRVRVGQHDTYSRIVFDWPRAVDYRIDRVGETVTVTFDRAGRLTTQGVAQAIATVSPRAILGGAVAATDPLTVRIEVSPDGAVRHFVSEGSNIAVDVADTAQSRTPVPNAPVVARTAPPAAPADPAPPPPAGPTPEETVAPAPEAPPAQAAPEDQTPPAAPPPADTTPAATAPPTPPEPPPSTPAVDPAADPAAATGAPETEPPAPAPEDAAAPDPAAASGFDLAAGRPPLPPMRPQTQPQAPADALPGPSGPSTAEAPEPPPEPSPSDPSPSDDPSPPPPSPPAPASPDPTADPPSPGPVEGPPAPDAAPVAEMAEQPLAGTDGAMGEPPGATGSPAVPQTAAGEAGETAGAPPPPDDSAAIVAFFDPGVPSALAVFRRDRALWVVLTAASRIDVNALAQATAEPLGAAEIAVARGGVALRYPDVPAGLPAVTQDGTRWRLALPAPDGQAVPASSVAVRPQPEFPVGARVLLDILNADQVVEIEDPSIGDRLQAVPVPDVGRGVDPARRFAEFELLATGQGAVVVPAVDELTVRPVADGIEIALPNGLSLSPVDDVGDSAEAAPFDPAEQLFDLAGWRSGNAGYLGNRQRLLNAVATAAPQARPARRLDLARFYLAEGNGLEARGVLDVLLAEEPSLADQPEVAALEAAVSILTGDPADGLAALSAPPLNATPEAAIWRGLAAARLDDWPRAAQAFNAAGLNRVESYPVPYAAEVIMAAAEAAARTGNAATADRLLLTLSRRTDGASDRLTRVDYIRGLIAEAQGEIDRAMERLAAAAQGRDELYAVRARLARVRIGLNNDRLTEQAALEALEGLRFAWRGDALERRILDRLADLQWRTGGYGEALSTWEEMAQAFPEDPETAGLQDRIDDRFVDLFTGPAFEEMSPLQAYAVFDAYREKVPEGAQGDRILERLSDRLATIDLLDRSSALLQTLVSERLPPGADRARVGTQLAAVDILDERPRQALTALAATAVDAEESENPDLLFERRLLRAKALADLGETDVALSALEGETDPLALAARLDIAYQIGDWALAAETLAALLGPPPPLGAALSDRERALVLNRAIALAQAQDRAGLDRLAIQYGPAMTGTPEASVFALITREEGRIPSPSDLEAIQREVAEIDLFRDFLDQARTADPPPAS